MTCRMPNSRCGIRPLTTAVTTYHRAVPHKTEPRSGIVRLFLMPCRCYFNTPGLVVDTGGAYGWKICSRWSRNTNPVCYLVASDYSLTASQELSPRRWA